jgi:hypothetical protein
MVNADRPTADIVTYCGKFYEFDGFPGSVPAMLVAQKLTASAGTTVA